MSKTLHRLVAPAILFFSTPAFAQHPPMDPIAASNRLTESHRTPVLAAPAMEAPWLMPGAARTPPAPQLQPQSPPMLGRATISIPVTWSSPQRPSPIPNALPTSDRPMIPCEPCEPPPPATTSTCEQPKIELPTHVEVLKCTPSTPAAPVQSTSMCRFVDLPSSTQAGPGTIMAVIRRTGGSFGNAAEIRKAIESTCHDRAMECLTEVAGERQVRVMLTVRTMADWQQIYAHLQELNELGEYGLVFQVRIRPQ